VDVVAGIGHEDSISLALFQVGYVAAGASVGGISLLVIVKAQ